MTDREPRPEPHATGFSTRAIPAASRAELLGAGITRGLLRVSVGLEDVEDLQADLADAFAAARAVVPALGAV